MDNNNKCSLQVKCAGIINLLWLPEKKKINNIINNIFIIKPEVLIEPTKYFDKIVVKLS